MRRLVVWGAGELGGAVARRWVEAGGACLAITRTEARHPDLKAAGVEVRALDDGATAAALVRPDDAVLLALPGVDNQIMAVGALRAAGAPPARVVLISSTGYYGFASGRVDEGARPADQPRAARIAALETVFRGWAPEGVVLRMGGLYRAGRGPFSALQRRGQPPPGPPDKTLALIHYDDATTATFAALGHDAPRPVYLCVVPPCPTRQDFYLAACVILELPLPTFEPARKRPPAEYDARRMTEDLLPTPAWPRWQAALVP